MVWKVQQKYLSVAEKKYIQRTENKTVFLANTSIDNSLH